MFWFIDYKDTKGFVMAKLLDCFFRLISLCVLCGYIFSKKEPHYSSSDNRLYNATLDSLSLP